MSASLVGSEMCIRDRPWRAPGCPGPCPSGRRRTGAAWGTPGPCACRNRTCLLYTSDAADDM
eukprot:6160409-Alexandrium_andersonii.AAC.1